MTLKWIKTKGVTKLTVRLIFKLKKEDKNKVIYLIFSPNKLFLQTLKNNLRNQLQNLYDKTMSLCDRKTENIKDNNPSDSIEN